MLLTVTGILKKLSKHLGDWVSRESSVQVKTIMHASKHVAYDIIACFFSC